MKIVSRFFLAIILCVASVTAYGNKNEDSVAAMSKRIVLHYFYMSTCPYCEKQEPVLAMLRDNTGISIKPMSIDGKPMQYSRGGKSITFYDGREFASVYGLLETPTIVVFEPPNNYAVLSRGFLDYQTLLSYLVHYGKQRELID